MANDDSATFFFDTNIESIVERIDKGLNQVQREANKDLGKDAKFTTNLPRDIKFLVDQARLGVGQINAEFKKLEKTGYSPAESLTQAYQGAIKDLTRNIARLNSGRGLNVEVGLKFAEAPLKAFIADVQANLDKAKFAQNINLGSRKVGTDPNVFKEQFESTALSQKNNKQYAAYVRRVTNGLARTAVSQERQADQGAQGSKALDEQLKARDKAVAATKKVADATESEAESAQDAAKSAAKVADNRADQARATEQVAQTIEQSSSQTVAADKRAATLAQEVENNRRREATATSTNATRAEAAGRQQQLQANRTVNPATLSQQAAQAREYIKDRLGSTPQREFEASPLSSRPANFNQPANSNTPIPVDVVSLPAKDSQSLRESANNTRGGSDAGSDSGSTTTPETTTGAGGKQIVQEPVLEQQTQELLTELRLGRISQDQFDTHVRELPASIATAATKGNFPKSAPPPAGRYPNIADVLPTGTPNGSINLLPSARKDSDNLRFRDTGRFFRAAQQVRNPIPFADDPFADDVQGERQKQAQLLHQGNVHLQDQVDEDRGAADDAHKGRLTRKEVINDSLLHVLDQDAGEPNRNIPFYGTQIPPSDPHKIPIPKPTSNSPFYGTQDPDAGRPGPGAGRPGPGAGSGGGGGKGGKSGGAGRGGVGGGGRVPPGGEDDDETPDPGAKKPRNTKYTNNFDRLTDPEFGGVRRRRFADDVVRLTDTYFALLRNETLEILRRTKTGFANLIPETPEFAVNEKKLKEKLANDAKVAARNKARDVNEAYRINDGLNAEQAAKDLRATRQAQLLRLTQNSTDVGGLNPNVKTIGGAGGSYVAEITATETLIFKRVQDGFDQILKGTSEFDAQIRRLRAQQKIAGGGGVGGDGTGRPSVLSSFFAGVSSTSFGSTGGLDTRGVIEGIAKSAGVSAKYAVLGSALYALQGALAGTVTEIVDFQDSYTELNIALDQGDLDKNLHFSAAGLNELGDAATQVGTNVGEAMDLAAGAVRSLGKGSNYSQEQLERFATSFAREATKISVLANTTLADSEGNLKATALGFNIPNETPGRVTDALAGGKALGGANVKDLSQALASSAVAAREAGFNIDETSALLSQILSETDEGGQLAATRFSKITSIIGGSAGKTAIRQLNTGLAPDQQVDTNATIKDQVQQLSAVYKDLNEAQRQQLVNSLGGTANARELIILLQSADKLIKDADEGFTGHGAEEFKKKLQDISKVLLDIQGQVKQIVVGVAQTHALDILGAGITVFDKLLNSVRQVVNAFNLIPDPIKRTLVYLGEALLIFKAITLLSRENGVKNFFGGAAEFIAPGRKANQLAIAEFRQKSAAKAAAATAEAGLAAEAAGGTTFAALRSSGQRDVLGARGKRTRSITGIDFRSRAEGGDIFAGLRDAIRGTVEESSGNRRTRRDERIINLLKRTGDFKQDDRNERKLARLGFRGLDAGGRPVLAGDNRPTLVQRALAPKTGNETSLARATIDRVSNASATRLTAASIRDAISTAAGRDGGRLQQVREDLKAERAKPAPFNLRSADLLENGGADDRATARQRLNRARLGTGAKIGGGLGAAAALIGPEAIAIGAVLGGIAFYQAVRSIHKAVEDFSTLKDLPTSFSAEDLSEAAKNLRSNAHDLRAASSGIFGRSANFVQGTQAREKATAQDKLADLYDAGANRVKNARDLADRSTSDVGTLAAGINLTSTDTLDESLNALQNSGRSATTQVNALLQSIDNLGNGSLDASRNLNPVEQARVSAGAGSLFGKSLKDQQETSLTLATSKAASRAVSGASDKSIRNGAIADSFGDPLGLIKFGRKQDNIIGRTLRRNVSSKAEDEFKFSKIDSTKAGNVIADATALFLKDNPNGISDKQGQEDLYQLYIAQLTRALPTLKPEQIKSLASTGLTGAKGALRQINDVNDPTASISEILERYGPLAQKAGQEAGLATSLVKPGSDPFGQGTALTSSTAYRDYLVRARAAAVKTGKSTPEQLEQFDLEIGSANVQVQGDTLSRQAQRDRTNIAQIPSEFTSNRSRAALAQTQRDLIAGGYDPVTGKRKTRKVKQRQTVFNDATGRKETRLVTVNEDVGPGIEAGRLSDLQASLAEQAPQVKRDELADKISARRAKIDPRDELGNSKADLQDARDQRALLKSLGEGAYTGKAKDDADLAVTAAQQAYRKEQIEHAIAARNVDAIPESAIDTATRNLQDSTDRLKALGKDNDQYNAELARNTQARAATAVAADALKSINRQLKIDLTNPVQVACEALKTADDDLKRITEQTRNSKPDVRAEQVGKATLARRQAEANVEAAQFSQFLSNAQTAEQLGTLSHKAFIGLLQGRVDLISAELAQIDNNTTQFQQLTDQKNQLLLAIKSAGDELSGVFNIGDIKIPTPYEVRRAIKERNYGSVYGANNAFSTAGNVTNDNSTRTVVINGAPIQQVMSTLRDMTGITTRTTSTRRTP